MEENSNITLNKLISEEKIELEKIPNAVYDPKENRKIMVTSNVEKRTSSRRYHTINLTCFDGFETGTKYRCVIILHPQHEHTNQAMEFICRINHLLDEHRQKIYTSVPGLPGAITAIPTSLNGQYSVNPVNHGLGGNNNTTTGGHYSIWTETFYRDWILHGLGMTSRQPYHEYANMQSDVSLVGSSFGPLGKQGTYSIWGLLFNGTTGGPNINITSVYLYLSFLLVFFAFFAMILGFAASGVSAVYAVLGLFSLLHGIYRVYQIRILREYTLHWLLVDLFASLFLFVLAAAASSGMDSSVGAAAAAFTYLQAIFLCFSAIYQYSTQSVGQGIRGGRGGRVGMFATKMATMNIARGFSAANIV
jgi:hypothetical protein